MREIADVGEGDDDAFVRGAEKDVLRQTKNVSVDICYLLQEKCKPHS